MHEALLLDADGNLFPSEEPAFDASVLVTNRLMEAIGSQRRFGADELRRWTTGKNFRTTSVALARDAGYDLRGAELDGWVRAEQAEVSAHLARVLKPHVAVYGVLSRLARSYTLAAVSSSALGRLDACFAATSLHTFIPPALRFSAEDSLPAPTSKPDPAIYLHALDQMRLAPSEAVAVEDSVPGATSAVAAGITTIGNLVFVPEDERERRCAALRDLGVAAVADSWEDVEALLPDLPGGAP